MLEKSFQAVAKAFMVALLLLVVTGCAVTQKKLNPALPVEPAKRPISEIVKADVTYTIDAYDPWESYNRRMYIFNYYFDNLVYLPVVEAYETIMPDFVETRVSNFFKHIGELKNLSNSILQLKGGSTWKTLGRIVTNTTIGLGGLFDPATKMGIHRQNEDFGQTLGVYEIGAGPYLVLPILGPSSLRDTAGLVVDTGTRTAVYNWIDPLENVGEKDVIELSISALEAVDKRHLEGFRYYEAGSPFEYDLIRLLYLKKRIFEINQ